MFENILKTLLDKVITKDEAAELSEKFDAVEKKIFMPRTDWKEFLKSQFGADIYALFDNLQDPKELSAIFGRFRKEISAIEVARLDIAFEPTYEFLTKISEWMSREAGCKILLDPKPARQILGGLQISFRGRFADVSLVRKLNDLLK